MTTGPEWVVLDTNVWIFGLRDEPDRPACLQMLQRLPRLYVQVPRQILLELRANLLKSSCEDWESPDQLSSDNSLLADR